MPKQMTIDGIEVPMPVEIKVSPLVIRLDHNGLWRAVLVRTSPTTSRTIGYVYAGEF